MKRAGTPALAGLCSWIVVLAGACSEARLIGDERDGGMGGNDVVGMSSTSGVGGAGGGPIDPEAAARVAVRLWSCGLGDVPEVSLVRFYTHLAGPDDAIDRLVQGIACIDAQQNGCIGVFDCLGISASTNPSCVEGCNGDVLHTCDGTNAIERTMDCKKLGLACAPDVKRCLAAPLGPTCDSTSTKSTCNGGVPEGCNGRIVHGPDCAAFGLSCQVLNLGVDNPLCVGEGPGCDWTLGFFGLDFSSGIACEGGKLRTCVNGGEHLIDCAERGAGFTCQTTDVGSFCGLDTDCTPPGPDQPTCVPGTKSLTICNAGRRGTVACDQLGFLVCDVDHCANALGGS